MPKVTNYKITGPLDLKGLGTLLKDEYEFLDISETEMGIDEEQWEVCLGWSHSGPVYGNSGWCKVEVLKKTKPVFGCKAYTVTGEIRGERNTYNSTVDIILNVEEVEQIKKLIANADSDDFLHILYKKMPKLYDFLYQYFYNLAWKQVVRDGIYFNLSRKEAEDAQLLGDEYQVLVPEEF